MTAVWKHFKGGRYRIIVESKLSDDPATELVTYVSLTNGELWTRRKDEWNELVAWPEGSVHPRFVPE